MAKRGKKYTKMIKNFKDKEYSLEEAVKVAKTTSFSKFPGSLELHLGISLPKDKEAKSVKGAVALPHTVSKKETKIVVFCEKEDAVKAKAAGAVDAGLEDLLKKVQGGWMDFDVVLATPSVMAKIAVLGKNLGPKGLMPNPKTGTLTTDVEATIGEFKKGKTKFACDDTGAIHMVVGKVDSSDSDVLENIQVAIKGISDTIGKPAASLLKSVTISPTMGAGVRVALSSFEKPAAQE